MAPDGMPTKSLGAKAAPMSSGRNPAGLCGIAVHPLYSVQCVERDSRGFPCGIPSLSTFKFFLHPLQSRLPGSCPALAA